MKKFLSTTFAFSLFLLTACSTQQNTIETSKNNDTTQSTNQTTEPIT